MHIFQFAHIVCGVRDPCFKKAIKLPSYQQHVGWEEAIRALSLVDSRIHMNGRFQGGTIMIPRWEGNGVSILILGLGVGLVVIIKYVDFYLLTHFGAYLFFLHKH